MSETLNNKQQAIELRKAGYNIVAIAILLNTDTESVARLFQDVDFFNVPDTDGAGFDGSSVPVQWTDNPKSGVARVPSLTNDVFVSAIVQLSCVGANGDDGDWRAMVAPLTDPTNNPLNGVVAAKHRLQTPTTGANTARVMTNGTLNFWVPKGRAYSLNAVVVNAGPVFLDNANGPVVWEKSF